MLSLRRSLSELDRLDLLKKAATECYVSAVETTGQHVVETDETSTRAFRKHLERLARLVKSADSARELKDTRASFQRELSAYANQGTRYLRTLKQQLTATSQALSEIIESIQQSDGDEEARIRTGLARLEKVAQHPEVKKICPEMEVLVATVEDSVGRLRDQNQLVVAQLRNEMDSLRGALDSAQEAAGRDPISGVLNRAEMMARFRAEVETRSSFCLIVLWISNARHVRRGRGSQVLDTVVAEFCGRLARAVGSDSLLGRWADEQFLALVKRPKPEAMWLSDNLAGQLAGPYVPVVGRGQREVTLRLRTGVIESASDTTEAQLLERIDKLLGALESVPG